MAGFYDWQAREAAGPTQRQLDEAAQVELMRDIYDASDGNYGVPRMYKAVRQAGLKVNRKRVERLMRRHGMAGRFRRRTPRTTVPGLDPYVIPDLVGRRFEPGPPDVAWCQDIYYIPTGEGWLYMATVLDLGSRRLIGYSMADHMRTELVLDALGMAVDARGKRLDGEPQQRYSVSRYARLNRLALRRLVEPRQFRSRAFRCVLEDEGLLGSMGRVASAGDNAAMESFFSLLQKNVLNRQTWATRQELRVAIIHWIEST